MMADRKILVTGGAGYIGSVLVPMLLDCNFRVIILDNLIYGQNSLWDHCHKEKLEIVNGDTRNKQLIDQLLPRIDIIIPLACIVGASACDKDPLAAKSVNLEAIQHILAKRHQSQLVIFPNTNSGYGIGQEDIYCDEKTPLKPLSLYGKLKVQAEKEILASGNTVTLRLATVFGASQRMRTDLLVNDFVYQAVTKKFVILFESHFKRNYVHVRDVARSFIHAIINFESMKNEPYNVGLSNANLSKLELCQEIQKQVPDFYIHEAPIGEDPDKRNYIVSNAKIEATGFKTIHGLQDGITELIKAYRLLPRNKFTN